ncbi:MAG TPA: hypothetical protein VGG27_19575 [Magnetospirillaceae bacterium]|jgi:hypothetical protein
MTTATFFRSRDFIAALFALIVAIGGAYLVHALPEENADEDEDTAEFRDTLKTDTQTINGMIADTKAGKNVSEFRIGMFSMGLLNTLSDRDPGLGGYFHKDGRMMQSYLTDVFQYHDAEEMDHVTAMAKEPASSKAKPEVRMAARDMLESLRHIPEGKDPPEKQAAARAALIDALTALNADLAKAVKE